MFEHAEPVATAIRRDIGGSPERPWRTLMEAARTTAAGQAPNAA